MADRLRFLSVVVATSSYQLKDNDLVMEGTVPRPPPTIRLLFNYWFDIESFIEAIFHRSPQLSFVHLQNNE
ncbi:hypothetical protein C8R32_10820 [Nitrosospira sp. Nsp5]|uniref:Uncharacterized protein n=1 Tax=Nitrosospira multiformis TaxID=1231 RepID=A0ABY0T6F1_9PROT|nr:hypothetical protein C8R32_10820 [Nitrosospira sp. Nsp5]SDQ32833.1 hypothetical protein SAMN05216402_0398 [Nitrosospira multiformis]